MRPEGLNPKPSDPKMYQMRKNRTNNSMTVQLSGTRTDQIRDPIFCNNATPAQPSSDPPYPIIFQIPHPTWDVIRLAHQCL